MNDGRRDGGGQSGLMHRWTDGSKNRGLNASGWILWDTERDERKKEECFS